MWLWLWRIAAHLRGVLELPKARNAQTRGCTHQPQRKPNLQGNTYSSAFSHDGWVPRVHCCWAGMGAQSNAEMSCLLSGQAQDVAILSKTGCAHPLTSRGAATTSSRNRALIVTAQSARGVGDGQQGGMARQGVVRVVGVPSEVTKQAKCVMGTYP